MRNAALILGLIGGIFGIGVGLFGYGFAELLAWLTGAAEQVERETGLAVAGEVETAQDPLVTKLLALFSPVLGLTGAAIAPSTPRLAALLLAGSAAGMLAGFGFGVFTMFPITLCAIAAVLAGLAKPDGRSSPGS